MSNKSWLSTLVVGAEVFWTDPDGGIASGTHKIDQIRSESGKIEDEDTTVWLKSASFGDTEALASELSPVNRTQVRVAMVIDLDCGAESAPDLIDALKRRLLSHIGDGMLTGHSGAVVDKYELHVAESDARTIDLQSALDRSVDFISGFEDDEDQEGVPELLADLLALQASSLKLDEGVTTTPPAVVLEVTREGVQVSASAPITASMVDYTWEEQHSFPMIPGRDERAAVSKVEVTVDSGFCLGVTNLAVEQNDLRDSDVSGDADED